MFSIMLFGWLVRASILLTIGWLVARWIETRSAAAAHRLLVIVFAGCALIPVAMALSPTWQWRSPSWLGLAAPPVHVVEVAELEIEPPLNRAIQEDSLVASSLHVGQVEEASQPSSSASVNENDSTVTDVLATKSRPENLASSNGPEAPALTFISLGNVSWAGWFVLAWWAWAAALMLRLLFSLVLLRRYVVGCDEPSQSVVKHVNDLASQLGVEQSARVRFGMKDTMPMSCWLGHPVIVLPSNFNEWPAEQRGITLSHELGHLVRRDAWADYGVQFVLCFLWMNPLAWWAAADVRRMRERACDEWVLTRSGVSPAKYAESLLAVVECCHAQRLNFSSPMAGRHDLETRLSWLMSRSDRHVMRPLLEVATLFFVFMTGMAVATGHPTAATIDSETVTPEVVLSEEPSAGKPAISVAGLVADEAGKPLAGMNVVLRGKVRNTHQYCNGLGHVRDVLAATKTDMAGRFEFSAVGIPSRMIEVLSKLREGQEGAQLLIWGPGKAIVWEPVSSFHEVNKRIQLAEETEFKGTLFGPDGTPLDDAKLRVSGFASGTTEISAFLDEPRDLNLFSSELNIETVTRDGQFLLPNMPADVRVMVQCVGQQGERDFLLIDTADGAFDKVKYRGGGSREQNVHRSPAKITLPQKPWVEIRIVDHTGKPVTGGGLEAVTKSRHFGGSVSVEGNGSAKLIVNDAGVHQVRYVADPLSPAIGVSQQVDIQVKNSEVVEFKLPKPIFIQGRVVDSETGAPIVGAYVGWWNRDRDEDSPAQQNTGALAVSDRNGALRLPIIEGEQRLYVRHEVDGYMIAGSREGTAVSVGKDGVAGEVVIKIGQGLTIKGVVTDDNDQPDAGAKVTVAETEGNFRKTSTVTDELGQYKIAGLSPTSKMRISTWSDAGAAQHFLNGDPNRVIEKNVEKTLNLTIKRGTTLTGRVLMGGKPVAGVTVKLKSAPPQPPEQDWTRYYFVSQSVSDSDGNYRVAGLHKGERFQVEVLPLGNAEVRDWQYSGGYVHEMKEEDGSTVELPDAVLSPNGQSLSGVVVDTEGNPVADYQVSASLVSSASRIGLSRPKYGPPPWTKSDKNGQFHLTYLPEEPLTLQIYKSNPKGGRIRYSAVQEVKLNDKEIRIVVDPKLGSGIEDLD